MKLGLGTRGNYPYACARVRAKKAALLTKDNYPKLLMMDLNEIGRFLGETQYNVEMTELASRYEGVDLIELGTIKNLARVYNDILGFTKGELHEMVASYLARWDIWNIKTILRGKFYGARIEDIREDLVPAGTLREENLDALIALESVAEVLEAIKKIEGIEIPEDVMADYQTTGRLSAVEDYLDKIYFIRLLKAIDSRSRPGKLLLAFIRKEIDMTNLITLLKLKKEKVSPDRIGVYLIEGGDELNRKELERLAATESFEALVAELSPFSFYEDIKDALEGAKEAGSLNDVSLAAKKHLMSRAERFSHLYPLSVLPIIDFMIRKKTEVDNIRIVARCKESGLDPETTKRLLVM